MGLQGDLAGVLGRCLEREAGNRPTAQKVFDVVGSVDNDGQVLFQWFESLDIQRAIYSNRRHN